MLCREDLHVDLSDCAFADSSFMLDLANLSRRLRRAGSMLVLLDPQPPILRLIERVGLDRLPGVALASAV